MIWYVIDFFLKMLSNAEWENQNESHFHQRTLFGDLEQRSRMMIIFLCLFILNHNLTIIFTLFHCKNNNNNVASSSDGAIAAADPLLSVSLGKLKKRQKLEAKDIRKHMKLSQQQRLKYNKHSNDGKQMRKLIQNDVRDTKSTLTERHRLELLRWYQLHNLAVPDELTQAVVQKDRKGINRRGTTDSSRGDDDVEFLDDEDDENENDGEVDDIEED
jgi:hypothetical protein